MPVRRAFFVWQFAAAVVLPLWVLTGYAIWGSGKTGFLGIALTAPLLVVTCLALAVLFSARGRIRRSRALDWPDVGVLAAFSLAVIGAGFFGPGTAWFGVLAVASALGGLWLATTELVTDVRSRMRETLTALGYRPPAFRGPVDHGEYVVLPVAPKR